MVSPGFGKRSQKTTISVFELPITKMFGLAAMRDSANETMNGSKDQERVRLGKALLAGVRPQGRDGLRAVTLILL
jgi:hypothetical protein